MISKVSFDSIPNRIWILFSVSFLLLLTTPKAMGHLEFLCKVSEVAAWLEDEIRTLETPITWPACYIYLDYRLIQSRF